MGNRSILPSGESATANGQDVPVRRIYPASQNDPNPVSQSLSPSAYTYRSQSIDLDRYAKLGLDSALTLALPLDLKAGFDQNGKHRNFPKPQGMSGSPVWMLLDENEEHTETSTFSIVGVATKYRRSERVLLASDISEAIRMIEAEAFPRSPVDK